MSGRHDVTSDKVDFKPDIEQNTFLQKIRTSGVCVAVKTIFNYFTLINTNVDNHMSFSTQQNFSSFKEHLVTFSLTFFGYVSKLNLQPNLNFKNY